MGLISKKLKTTEGFIEFGCSYKKETCIRRFFEKNDSLSIKLINIDENSIAKSMEIKFQTRIAFSSKIIKLKEIIWKKFCAIWQIKVVDMRLSEYRKREEL